ncbi:hypothetical protein HSX10_12840 [Winogradskyella undariae]|uniref:hypothetical protein n=1 Tax=Winogradskyella TaxID=286104 RepID=UPI00156AF493|nr:MULTISPECIES: hypothetical protein [Winogradskyella]NRR92457.1 hypothetical protein [Winogradskyella undariae]QNK78495.1 hypothetical protein H7F37_05315 [Winogradskyella sp. PAMC22761]QXP78491.1 hypothetical protein H0I32_14915 [Winogradskyella sp. HaHa_3_26]
MKTTFTSIFIGILSILALSWLFINHQEDVSMDLIFDKKIIDGDLVFRSVNTGTLDATHYNEFGIIEKSLGKLYVWDNQNTMKRSFQDWVKEGNGGHIKVYSIKSSNFNINTLELQNGTYSHVMNSEALEFVTESK